MGRVSLAVRDEELTSSAPPAADQLKEWNPHKRWNPFNSHKLLAHVARWRLIRRGRPLPPPVLVTVDPTNLCNLNCVWCNAAYVRRQRHHSLAPETLLALADFLPRWGAAPGPWPPGVEAVCLAGGGEPLLNPATGPFIDRLAGLGIEIGMVTNGTKIVDHIDPLSQCTWIGVSVDAGSATPYNRLKGSTQGRTPFRVFWITLPSWRTIAAAITAAWGACTLPMASATNTFFTMRRISPRCTKPPNLPKRRPARTSISGRPALPGIK